jgi:hypothetical protein
MKTDTKGKTTKKCPPAEGGTCLRSEKGEVKSENNDTSHLSLPTSHFFRARSDPEHDRAGTAPRTLYISGPMAGLPNENREVFAAVAYQLLDAGHTVFNPAGSLRWSDPVWGGAAWHGWERDEEWARRNATIRTAGLSQPDRRIWLRDDIIALSRCDGIVMLPGWEDSWGARAEHAWAEAVGIRVHHWILDGNRINLIGTARSRPNNENLFTLGSVFQANGYDTAFIYGGNGFFDNMNYFFANNGFRIVDRPAKTKAGKPAIVFENAWGVCDEDLLDWTLAEADHAHAKGKNFYHFVMTTSNHRPFTWPAGRINIPNGSREGAVKYTDHAIGRFIARARTRPWFKDTLFVVVADHCASVAGKRELEVTKYEIPLLIYAPEHIKPRVIDTLASQIDYAPTLLGLLNFTYQSNFLGRDILRPAAGNPPRAFISNYQKIALIDNTTLALLKPVAVSQTFDCNRATGSLSLSVHANPQILHDTIAYYQCASELLATGRQKNATHPANPPLPVDMARHTGAAPPHLGADAARN